MFSHIDHFTVGWNGAGNLVSVPVMRTRATMKEQFRVETIEEVALKRKCTVLMIDFKTLPEFEVYTAKVMGFWFVRNNVIKADNPLEAKAAIDRLIATYAKRGIDISTIDCKPLFDGSGKITS
jgi:hypothetical protein